MRPLLYGEPPLLRYMDKSNSSKLHIAVLLGLVLFAGLAFGANKAHAQGVFEFDVQSSAGGGINFGRTSTAEQKIALNYRAESMQLICSVDWLVYQNGVNTDGLVLKVYQNSSSATASSTMTLSPFVGQSDARYSNLGDIPTSSAGERVNFPFPGCVRLTGGYWYAFVLERTGAQSDTLMYTTAFSATSEYSNAVSLFLLPANAGTSGYDSNGWGNSTGSGAIPFPREYSVTFNGQYDFDITAALTATSTAIRFQTGFFASCTNATSSQSLLSQVGCVLFNPSAATLGYLSDSYEEMQTVFPFSLFFGLNDIVTATIAAYDDSGLTLDWTVVLGGTTSTIELLSPTTLTDHGFSATVLEWWYNLVLMGCTVLLAYGIYKVIYHPH